MSKLKKPTPWKVITCVVYSIKLRTTSSVELLTLSKVTEYE